MRYSKFLFLIGIIMFAVLLYSLGPEGITGIAASISKANPFLFALALLIVIPEILLKGLKQSVLLRAFGKKIGLVESSQLWLAGYLLGALSPGRSGDFLRAVYFQKNFGIKLGNGLSSVLLDRIMDVGLLLVLGIIGLIFFSLFYSFDPLIILALIAVLVVFIIALLLLTKKSIVRLFGRPFFNILVPQKFRAKLSRWFEDFYQGLAEYRKSKGIVFSALILTIAAWFLFFLQAYLFALSLGLNLSIVFIFWIMPAVVLIEILPISFSGIGTRDATLIFFLGFAGIAAEAAVSFSLMILSLEILQAFFGAFFLRKLKNS